MSRRKIKAGSTSVSVPIFVQDTSSTTGAGLGSLVYNTSSLAARYRREGDSSWTSITLATMTLGTWASGGFITSSGVTGKYEIGIPNAALASGAKWCEIEIYGAANMLPVLLEFELDAIDYQDAVRAGLTALPNAAAGASGGLPLSTAADIATAVRDIDNSEPEDGSLGATLNAIKLIFNGVTSIGNWLRRIVRKDAGTVNMGVAAAEINTGGTATFDGTTDSLEALRDHGDVSWITGGGGGTGSLTIPVHVVDDNGDDVVGKVVTVRLSGVLQDISEATDSNGDTTVSLDPGDNYEFVVPGGNGFGGATASVDVEDTTPVEIEVEKLSHTASEPESTTLVLHVRDLSPMADAANVPVTVRLLKLANGSTGEGFAQNSKTVNSDSNGDVEFLDFPRGATCQVRVGQSNEAKWVTFVTADGELTNIAGAII